jgi:hypothetical protein
MNRKDADRQESLTAIRELLNVGDTVFTKLDSVSRTGMSRNITPLVIRDGEPRYLGYHVGRILQHKTDDHSVRMQGCGMDMGFEMVYLLGRYLFPEGFGERCRDKGCTFRPATKQDAALATDHHFRGRNGDTCGWDNDGGYALNHRWI